MGLLFTGRVLEARRLESKKGNRFSIVRVSGSLVDEVTGEELVYLDRYEVLLDGDAILPPVGKGDFPASLMAVIRDGRTQVAVDFDFAAVAHKNGRGA